jgi:hypothetical protein
MIRCLVHKLKLSKTWTTEEMVINMYKSSRSEVRKVMEKDGEGSKSPKAKVYAIGFCFDGQGA